MLWRLTTYLKYTWDSSSLLLEVLSYDSVDITQALPIFSQKLWIMSFIKYIFWKSNKILSLSNIDLWRKMPKDKFLERSSSGDVCMVSSIFICHLSIFFFLPIIIEQTVIGWTEMQKTWYYMYMLIILFLCQLSIFYPSLLHSLLFSQLVRSYQGDCYKQWHLNLLKP